MQSVQVSKKKDLTFMPTVAVNPLSSEAALKERAELALSTKDRKSKENASPVMKSLFDYKGNSRHKDATEN